MLEGNVFWRAAFWGHMGRIRNGHCKNPAQAIMAHPVATCELRSLDNWHVVRAASEAVHFLQTHLRSGCTPKQT
jgi:hypothetical protein